MSETYNGVAGNVTPPSALTISNVSAGATPTVTVSGTLPASIVTKFTGTITGVQGATGVNGSWTLTKTGASTFTVPTGAPGTFVNSGSPSVQPTFLEGITIPDDGDALTASSVNAAIESIQDQINLITLASGLYKVTQYFFLSTNVILNNVLGSCPNTVASTWADWSGPIAALTPFVSIGTGQTVNVNSGDVVLTTVSVNLFGNSITAGNNCMIDTWAASYVPGGAPTFLQSGGAGAQIRIQPAGTPLMSPCTVRSNFTVSTSGLFDFKLRLITTGNATAADFQLIGGLFAEAIVLRPTSAPQ